jgi:hypothetical protein
MVSMRLQMDFSRRGLEATALTVFHYLDYVDISQIVVSAGIEASPQ